MILTRLCTQVWLITSHVERLPNFFATVIPPLSERFLWESDAGQTT